jgi:hypothetical protein
VCTFNAHESKCVLSMCMQRVGEASSLEILDRDMARWIWYFVAFNQFIGGVFGNTLASQFPVLLREGPWQGET